MMTAQEAVRRLVESIRDGIDVFKPCTVTKFNSASGTVEIRLENGVLVPDVPVYYNAVDQDCGIYFPIKKGTKGGIICSDSDISAFLSGAKTPQTARTHDLSDSFFIPGFAPKSTRLQASDNAKIQNSQMKIILHPDGKIQIEGAAAELITVLSSFLGTVSQLTTALDVFATATSGATIEPTLGPAAIALKTATTTAGSDITDEKGQLDTLKA
jgi:hypothetical protein